MTCLYCGKKLGFFSRYKDTPFCSEEHLRTHQDELERALIERLGSKAKAPVKSLNDLVNPPEPPPMRSLLGLEAATRMPAPTAAAPPAPEPPPPPPPPPAPKPPSEPAPLNEDYIFDYPNAAPALEVSRPLIPPASFAIIVQADCCTPNLHEFSRSLSFPRDEEEFTIAPEGLFASSALPVPELPPAEDEPFETSPDLRLPNTSGPSAAFEYVLDSDILPLEYEATSTSLHHTALGQREEITPRPRFRFPYAASQVSSSWQLLPDAEEIFSFTSSEEWDPILPEPGAIPNLSAGVVSQVPEIAASVEVPLTISALMRFDLDGADTEEFGDTLLVHARALAGNAPLATDCTSGDWQPQIHLPAAATRKDFRPSWRASRSNGYVPPVSFPSLFQLSPAMPPRPESKVS